MGYSEKKAQKWVDKYVANEIDASYESYINNKPVWDNEIASAFKSIKEFVSKSSSDDDW